MAALAFLVVVDAVLAAVFRRLGSDSLEISMIRPTGQAGGEKNSRHDPVAHIRPELSFFTAGAGAASGAGGRCGACSLAGGAFDAGRCFPWWRFLSLSAFRRRLSFLYCRPQLTGRSAAEKPLLLIDPVDLLLIHTIFISAFSAQIG